MPIRIRKPGKNSERQPGETYREGQDARGLHCPRCSCQHFKVVYTRHIEQGRIERRRECRNCHYRVTTWETIAF